VKKCLVKEACAYENRTRDLTSVTQNSTDCNITETESEAYRAKQCNKVRLLHISIYDKQLAIIFRAMRVLYAAVAKHHLGFHSAFNV